MATPSTTQPFTSVAIGTDGTIMGTIVGGQIRRYVGAGTWSSVAGPAMVQLSVRNASEVWGITGTKELYRWGAQNWQAVTGGGSGFTNVSVATDGTSFGVTSDGEIWRFVPPDYTPQKTPGVAGPSSALDPSMK